jgi:hypothetical protein
MLPSAVQKKDDINKEDQDRTLQAEQLDSSKLGMLPADPLCLFLYLFVCLFLSLCPAHREYLVNT